MPHDKQEEDAVGASRRCRAPKCGIVTPSRHDRVADSAEARTSSQTKRPGAVFMFRARAVIGLSSPSSRRAAGLAIVIKHEASANRHRGFSNRVDGSSTRQMAAPARQNQRAAALRRRPDVAAFKPGRRSRSDTLATGGSAAYASAVRGCCVGMAIGVRVARQPRVGGSPRRRCPPASRRPFQSPACRRSLVT